MPLGHTVLRATGGHLGGWGGTGMGGDTVEAEGKKKKKKLTRQAQSTRHTSLTCRRSGDAQVQQRPDSQLMNIYRSFVLRVLTGEAEVLDHEQMKPCNQSVIQAAVKVKGFTLRASKRHALPCPRRFIYAGRPHGPLQERICFRQQGSREIGALRGAVWFSFLAESILSKTSPCLH